MTHNLAITIAQINPTIGDVIGNTKKVKEAWEHSDADLIVFPELILSAYLAEDLFLKPSFIDALENAVEALISFSKSHSTAAIIPTAWRNDGTLYNAALVIQNGEIIFKTYKHDLPNYNIHDEKRHFTPGTLPDIFEFKGVKIGIPICEDIWHPEVCAHLKQQGAELLISPNGSPYSTKKKSLREEQARARATDNNIPLIYINQVGGQDDLVFDGGSFAVNEDGEITHSLPRFESCIHTINLSKPALLHAEQPSVSAIYKAITLGTHDYIIKNGFSKVVLGLSGGIDSAIVAAVAVDAIGESNVHCIMMPSAFTSTESLDDAKACADMLGCSYEVISIKDAVETFENTLPNLSGIAHENIQSRIRGLILMAQSNANGAMLLSTGNKSEMAVGYATLYGDMNGGYNPIKDVYKTDVYNLAHHRGLPDSIITKAPTAELREDQTDQDSLPSYDVLDDILKRLIEEDLAPREIKQDQETVLKVQRLLNLAEYKRHQSCPGPKITPRAFTRERRYPITNGFI